MEHPGQFCVGITFKSGSIFVRHKQPGVRAATEALAALLRSRAVGTIGFEVLESALRSGEITHRLQRLDVQAEARQARQQLQASVLEAVARIQALQPDVQILILAGGGVDLLDGNGLPTYETAPGGRYAVADGLSRIAAGL